jgi:putative ABC transport system permease protein
MSGFNGILLARSRGDFPRIREEFQARLGRVEFPDPEHFSRMSARLTARWEDYLSRISNVDEDGELQIRHQLPGFLGMAAAFMLLPLINLISVNMSRIFERTSEIGVRKAFGASSLHLVGQFVLENIVLCIIGGALALLGVFVVVVVVNASGLIPEGDFRLNYRVFIYALLLASFFGALSGAYPAWRMSRIHPVEALRGGIR